MHHKRPSYVGRRAALLLAIGACAALAGCTIGRPGRHGLSSPALPVVTADIQAAIEKHVEEQCRLGHGYFPLPFGDKQLRLKLVRVHTEYLATLGPRRNFACVDLADISGDVYDVDFFLSGDPGAMTVTETTVHKLNGQPFYVWEQNTDKTWRRVPVDKASEGLLGVITGKDEFDFRYAVTLPEMTNAARLWLPYPVTDPFQTVEVKAVSTPGTRRLLEENQHGNQVLLLELNPQDSGKQVEILYHVQRREKAAYAADASTTAPYLAPERLTPSNETFRAIAEKATEGKKEDLVRARALYDYVIDHMRYMKYGTNWGNGDAVCACNAATGNCSDFHALFIALARSIRIPARFACGASIPSERNEGGIDGYHCWAEFYAEGKWWPVDVSEADKYSSLATYYFGHHPANRFEFSRGRDLVVDPGPASGPINFLAYPVLEIDGQKSRAKVAFSFSRDTSRVASAQR